MARIKSKWVYPRARVHHLVLWKYDDKGNTLITESFLRSIMEKKKQQYISFAFILHDSDYYDDEAVSAQNELRDKVYLRELMLLSEAAGLAEDETTQSGYIKNEEVENAAKKQAYKLVREIKEGEKKPDHWHIIINFGSSRNVFEIANWFGVDSSRDEIKTGRNAVENAWLYLIHAHHPNKYQYARENVISSFDYTEDINKIIEEQHRRESQNPTSEQINSLVDSVYSNGLKLSSLEYAVYNKNKKRFDTARQDYLYKNFAMPVPRETYYIDTNSPTKDGKCISGLGKTTASREFAIHCAIKCGAPSSYTFEEMTQNGYIFVAGSPSVMWSKYDGEPVILFNEISARELVKGCCGIDMVKELLDIFPTKKMFNVKYGSVCPVSSVLIFNGKFDFETFKKELTEIDKGDKVQFDRRFWGNIKILDSEKMQIFINEYLFNDPYAAQDKMRLMYSTSINFARLSQSYSGEAKKMISGKAFEPLLLSMENAEKRFTEDSKISDPSLIGEEAKSWGTIIEFDEAEEVKEMKPSEIELISKSSSIDKLINYMYDLLISKYGFVPKTLSEIRDYENVISITLKELISFGSYSIIEGYYPTQEAVRKEYNFLPGNYNNEDSLSF